MFIFTPGFAFWYACTAGSRVESAQTVISPAAFWATGANDAVADAWVVGVALAHPARRAPAAARQRAAALRLVRWPAPTVDTGDLIVLPFYTCVRVGPRCPGGNVRTLRVPPEGEGRAPAVASGR